MSAVLGPSRPPVFPPMWASGWGEDRIGLWAEFTVNGVTTRYRWIRPGQFTMDSPFDEPGRRANEQQRDVSIQAGFWLGDTACIQALWQAVMEVNPSHRQAADHPVEQVSWFDCRTFCDRLNDLFPDIHARLPYEAEWEYACRAGSTTVFSFGESITGDQVNYDAQRPLEGSPTGVSRKETVSVKLLPANPWGLYQMHGNVWEWCLDPYERMVPSLGNDNIERVLRGGSLGFSGEDVRSAARAGFRPSNRLLFAGFRLITGPPPGKGRNPLVIDEPP